MSDEWKKLYVTQLANNLKYNLRELDGIPLDGQLQILENYKKSKSRSPNTPIINQPTSYGQKKFGIDPYITFDKVKGEIKMQIPIEELLDPEKNKKLGERI